jgi:hypothetical protein
MNISPEGLVCSVTFVSHSVDFYTNSGSAVTNIVRKVYPFWVVLFYFQIRTCSRYITTKNKQNQKQDDSNKQTNYLRF